MALVTVRTAAERLGVGVLDAETLGPHRARADDTDRRWPPSGLRNRNRSADGSAATGQPKARAVDGS